MIPGFAIGIALFIPWLIGSVSLSFLFPREELTVPAKISLSFILGTGILTIVMLSWNMLGGSFAGQGLHLFLLGLIFIGIIRSVSKKRSGQGQQGAVNEDLVRKELSRPSPYEIYWEFLDIIIILFVVFQCVYIFWRAFHIPVYGFDPLKINTLNAKVFFFNKNIVLPQDILYRGYPLHVSLLQTWMVLNLGYWSDQIVKVFIPFYLLSYIVIHYEFVNYFLNSRRALWSVGLLFTSNLFALHASLGYMDFTLMVYNCVTLMMIFLWYAEKETRFLVLAGVFAGISTFTKREGMAYLLVYGALFVGLLFSDKSLSGRRMKTALNFIFPCLGISLLFPLFKFMRQGMSVGVVYELGRQNLARIPFIFSKLIQELFWSGNWNVIWSLLVFSSFFSFRSKIHPFFKWFCLCMTLFFVILFLLFLCTNAYIWIEQRDTTLSRLILHFFPLAVLALIFMARPQQDSAGPQQELL